MITFTWGVTCRAVNPIIVPGLAYRNIKELNKSCGAYLAFFVKPKVISTINAFFWVLNK